MEKLKDIIGETFGGGEMYDLIIHTFRGYDYKLQEIKEGKKEATELVKILLDDHLLIYYDDCWAIMAYYQTPKEADYCEAVQLLEEDLIKVINKWAGVKNEL